MSAIHNCMIIKFRNILNSILVMILLGLIQNIRAGDLQTVQDDPGGQAYPFKATDGVYISTFPDTTSFLNGIFPIDDQGFIDFPIVGRINVVRMTAKELETFLRSNFNVYIKQLNIDIKPLVRISLSGGFQRPGFYYIDQNRSLWEAVRLAGGTLLSDGINEMVWERGGYEKSDDMVSLVENGTSLRKMGFKSGDQIWTPTPETRTFWDVVRDITPIITLATTMILVYQSYQRDLYMVQSSR